MSEQRIAAVDPDETDDEHVKRLLDNVAELDGDGNLQRVVARRPEILEGFQAYLGAALRGEDSKIEPHIKELMRLKSAEINRCTYCGTVRIQDVRDKVGPKEDDLFGDLEPTSLTTREALAVEFAKQMGGDPNYITDEFFDELREEFTDDEILELVMTECVYKMGHTISNTLQVGTSDENDHPAELEYPLDEPKSQPISGDD
jgi:alkylhydroperoxidase family enzyme